MGLAQYPATVLQKVTKQLELGRRQRHELPVLPHLVGVVLPHLVGVVVQFDVGEGQPRRRSARGGSGGGPAQHRADACKDLVQTERFGDVVIAADGQPGDLVFDGIASCQEHDWAPVALCRQPAHHLEPVDARHHHVQNHQVRLVVPRRAQRLLPVGRRLHLEPGVAQARGQQLHDVGVVLDDQQPCLGSLLLAHRIAFPFHRSSHRSSVVPVDSCRLATSWEFPENHRRCSAGRTASANSTPTGGVLAPRPHSALAISRRAGFVLSLTGPGSCEG